MIKQGCALASVILLGLFGGYLSRLWGRIQTAPAIILAGFGSLGLVMVVPQLTAVILGLSVSPMALRRFESAG